MNSRIGAASLVGCFASCDESREEEEALLPVRPLCKTQDDLNAVSSEGLDEVAQFRAGQKYLT